MKFANPLAGQIRVSFASNRLATVVMTVALLGGSAWAQVPKMKPTAKSASVLMAEARALYRDGKYQTAIELYNQVPSTSALWTEALEEKASANARLGQYPEALSLVKTLTHVPLSKEAGLEAYLVGSLIRLRTCQYDEMYRLFDHYKAEAKTRLVRLSESAAEAEARSLWRALKAMGKTLAQVDRSQIPKGYVNHPRHFERDRGLRSAQDEAGFVSRYVQLALKDKREIERITARMLLVESEAASRVLLAKPLDTSAAAPKQITARSGDLLWFPDDPDEVWLDEVHLSRHSYDGCEKLSASLKKPISIGGRAKSGGRKNEAR